MAVEKKASALSLKATWVYKRYTGEHLVVGERPDSRQRRLCRWCVREVDSEVWATLMQDEKGGRFICDYCGDDVPIKTLSQENT